MALVLRLPLFCPGASSVHNGWGGISSEATMQWKVSPSTIQSKLSMYSIEEHPKYWIPFRTSQSVRHLVVLVLLGTLP